MQAHHSLRSACLNRVEPERWEEIAGGRPSDKVCKTADVPARFKSGVWKQFGFLVSRNGEEDKVTDRQKLGLMVA